MKSHTLGALALALATASSANAAVWDATETWNEDWENRYAEWASTSWDVDFFTRPGTPYTGLSLDCADTVYSMRIIFAYENKLPFAIADSTGGKKPITNAMARFDKIAAEKRIRSFLQYIYNVGFTGSLPNDTYPTAVNRQAIRSGVILLTDKESHHSWTVQKIDDKGIPHLVYSSRPAKTQIMKKVGYPSTGFMFPGGLKAERHVGFRAFRQPEHIGMPAWKVPGYSLEQYQIPIAHWRSIVQDKLALVQETPEEKLTRLYADACQSSLDRVGAVNEGLAYLAKLPAKQCLNAQEYDDYSTPNRDQRLKDAFVDLAEANTLARALNAEIPAELRAKVDSVLVKPVPGDASKDYCPVTFAEDKILTLHEVRRRSLNALLSNNPHDALEYRWGVKKGKSPRAARCPVY